MGEVSTAKSPSFYPGKPSPLGATPEGGGINFALYAPDVQALTLGIFPEAHAQQALEIPLDPSQNLTEGVWHTWIDSPPKEGFYAYKIGGKWIPDPYAKELNTLTAWAAPPPSHVLGKLYPSRPSFDWEGISRPQIPMEELIIYEMHVRGFTQDPSSGANSPGTFRGVVEKIPHLLDLGINAVELLPLFEFDETAHFDPHLLNYWGYSSNSFFAPMARYGSPADFKGMVKALHRAGIEVIVDVVYNHFGTDHLDYLAKSTYFILDEHGNHTNYTGCGNTINTNHPQVMALILSSLSYYAEEMQIDGFRFDLASIFCRAADGSLLNDPPIVRQMLDTPTLQDVKLIVEPWDCTGLYQVGSFPGGKRFSHWNGAFRDHVRRFLKGEVGQAGAFAHVVSGSADFKSVSFVTAHDGFTLCDLVSYNEKHNEGNGEGNRDGSDTNESWNCGVEGPTENPAILSLRQRQMKNFFLALLFSMGTPMLLMGDEYGHSRLGNNNAYCQDNRLNYFLWDQLADHQELFDFVKRCIALRKECTLFKQHHFLDGSLVTWHNADWSEQRRLVSFSLHDQSGEFFLSFNAHFDWAELTLPAPPEGRAWRRLLDTANHPGPEIPVEGHYRLAPYSSLLIFS